MVRVGVGVLGHTGKQGKSLVKTLSGHPHAEIVYLHSNSEPNKIPLSKSRAEFFFSALNNGISRQYEHEWEGFRGIDLSADHRLCDEWVYGLPELNKDKIRNAQNVANPGCYPTSIILGVYPIKEKVRNVRVASTSGISGAGMEVQEEDNFLIYKEGRQHEHIPEIEKMLGLKGILFVPQRIDVADIGIISTIFADYTGNDDLVEIYKEFYKSEPFVRIVDKIETKRVNGTNFCDIKILKYGDQIIVLSALDNLIKGGSGQAVQNFNIMYGFDETEGLL